MSECGYNEGYGELKPVRSIMHCSLGDLAAYAMEKLSAKSARIEDTRSGSAVRSEHQW